MTYVQLFALYNILFLNRISPFVFVCGSKCDVSRQRKLTREHAVTLACVSAFKRMFIVVHIEWIIQMVIWRYIFMSTANKHNPGWLRYICTYAMFIWKPFGFSFELKFLWDSSSLCTVSRTLNIREKCSDTLNIKKDCLHNRTINTIYYLLLLVLTIDIWAMGYRYEKFIILQIFKEGNNKYWNMCLCGTNGNSPGMATICDLYVGIKLNSTRIAPLLVAQKPITYYKSM